MIIYLKSLIYILMKWRSSYVKSSKRKWRYAALVVRLNTRVGQKRRPNKKRESETPTYVMIIFI